MKRGFITILSVVLIGAVAVALTTAVLYMSTNNLVVDREANDSLVARHYAESCGQIALQGLRDNQNFSGTTSYAFLEGGCSAYIENLGGGVANISAMGTSSLAVRKVKISTSALRPDIIISSWQEVADF
jgi:hypothetical protein